MKNIKDLFQSADWKKEKHVPVIDTPDKVKKGEFFNIKVEIGKEIPHPNTTEHHIRWIDIYFLPKNETFPCQIGKFQFNSHGESAQGPNTSTIYTHPAGSIHFKTEKSGTIFAISYCNIHGLWQNSQELRVE